MIIPIPNRLNNDQVAELNAIAAQFNVHLQPIIGAVRTIYAIIGDERSPALIKRIEGLSYIDRVDTVQEPYKLMSRQSDMAHHKIKVGKCTLGEGFAVIAGHCAIDFREPALFLETAHAVKEAGADMLRGGVWKPRTSPYSFQGDRKSLEILVEAREQTGLPINTEVMDLEQLELCIDARVDSLQIGARNALNYKLLSQVGEITRGTPINVVLKRSMHMGPVSEFILAAEYLVARGNPNVIMCPRGTAPSIREFRNMPDESITLLLKERTWAPVIIDPSHSVGKAIYVPNACLAAAGYGADGILVETNINPRKGIGDDPKQAITPEVLSRLVTDCRDLAEKSRKYLPAEL